MKRLHKLLKQGFLAGYLQDALEAAPRPAVLAVLDRQDEPLAMAGEVPPHRDSAWPFTAAALRFPLHVEGVESGSLILEDPSSANQVPLEPFGRFLATSLAEIMRQHQLRRSLGDEALEQYRERALISRAVLHLNSSMRMRQVVSALINECESSLGPQYSGLMYILDRGRNRYLCCDHCGPLDQEQLGPIVASRLFKDIIQRGRGEFINDLSRDERWDNDVPDVRSLMVVPVQASGDAMGALVFAGASAEDAFSPKQLRRMDTLSTVAGIAMANAMHFDQTRKILLALIQAMATAIDSRDKTTAGHSQRVAQLALGLARAVNRDTKYFGDQHFGETDLQELYYAGLLHDVGKIGVREEVLTKSTRLPNEHLDLIGLRLAFWGAANNVPWEEDFARFRVINESYGLTDQDREVIERFHAVTLSVADRSLPALTQNERNKLLTPRGNLTPDEWVEIYRHPAESHRILQHIPLASFFPRFLTIIRQHHERLDGSGYPDGIRGDEIILQSRILAIVDVYDALCNKRHYKDALPRDRALAILGEEAGAGKLDENLVSVFCRDIEAVEASTASEDAALAALALQRGILEGF